MANERGTNERWGRLETSEGRGEGSDGSRGRCAEGSKAVKPRGYQGCRTPHSGPRGTSETRCVMFLVRPQTRQFLSVLVPTLLFPLGFACSPRCAGPPL